MLTRIKWRQCTHVPLSLHTYNIDEHIVRFPHLNSNDNNDHYRDLNYATLLYPTTWSPLILRQRETVNNFMKSPHKNCEISYSVDYRRSLCNQLQSCIRDNTNIAACEIQRIKDVPLFHVINCELHTECDTLMTYIVFNEFATTHLNRKGISCNIIDEGTLTATFKMFANRAHLMRILLREMRPAITRLISKYNNDQSHIHTRPSTNTSLSIVNQCFNTALSDTSYMKEIDNIHKQYPTTLNDIEQECNATHYTKPYINNRRYKDHYFIGEKYIRPYHPYPARYIANIYHTPARVICDPVAIKNEIRKIKILFDTYPNFNTHLHETIIKQIYRYDSDIDMAIYEINKVICECDNNHDDTSL